jgi:hypothetical protein
VQVALNSVGRDNQAESHPTFAFLAFRKQLSRNARNLVIVVMAMVSNPVNA